MSEKYVPVTIGQVMCVRKIANEKRVGCVRFQKALNDGSFRRFLESRNVEPMDIKAPKGARVHILEVEVEQDRKWQAALNAAGPDTPKDYSVRQVGDQYPPVGKGKVKEKLILLNFPNGDGNWDKAIAWAKAKCLKRTHPREIFAIGEQYPKLHRQLGETWRYMNLVYVVATTDIFFDGDRHACYVRWFGSERIVVLRWVKCFSNADAWFVFRE